MTIYRVVFCINDNRESEKVKKIQLLSIANLHFSESEYYKYQQNIQKFRKRQEIYGKFSSQKWIKKHYKCNPKYEHKNAYKRFKYFLKE